MEIMGILRECLSEVGRFCEGCREISQLQPISQLTFFSRSLLVALYRDSSIEDSGG